MTRTYYIVADQVAWEGIGWWSGLVAVSAEAMLPDRAPKVLHGRVFALQLTCTNLASVVPALAAGLPADRLGLDVVIRLAAEANTGRRERSPTARPRSPLTC